jgi:hypothetical protein
LEKQRKREFRNGQGVTKNKDSEYKEHPSARLKSGRLSRILTMTVIYYVCMKAFQN